VLRQVADDLGPLCKQLAAIVGGGLIDAVLAQVPTSR